MSTRTEKGLEWLRWLTIVAAIGFGTKALTSISMGAHVLNTLAANFAQFIGAVLLWGSLAFILGWLFGKAKDSNEDN
jgi:hypothetical protein